MPVLPPVTSATFDSSVLVDIRDPRSGRETTAAPPRPMVKGRCRFSSGRPARDTRSPSFHPARPTIGRLGPFRGGAHSTGSLFRSRGLASPFDSARSLRLVFRSFRNPRWGVLGGAPLAPPSLRSSAARPEIALTRLGPRLESRKTAKGESERRRCEVRSQHSPRHESAMFCGQYGGRDCEEAP